MMVLAASRATTRADTVPPLPFMTSRSRWKPWRLQLALQAAHVAVEDRLHGGIHRRGGAALIFAEFRQQRMPERDVFVGPQGARDLAGAQLVRRVGVGVQEVDDEALAASRDQRVHRRRQRRLVERGHHLAACIHALGHLEAQLARDDRLEGAGHAVGLGPGAPAQLERVAEAARGDQPDLGDLALQHRVGGGRGAVDDQVEIGGRHAGCGDRLQHAGGLVGGRGRDFRQPDVLAARARFIQQQVREGPADIDADNPPHAPPGTPVTNRMSLAYEQSGGCPATAGLFRLPCAADWPHGAKTARPSIVALHKICCNAQI